MEAGSSGREVARRSGDRIVVRAEPVRCRMRLNGLTTSDEHSIDLTFSCTVSALDQPAERQMLAETFLTDRVRQRRGAVSAARSHGREPDASAGKDRDHAA